MALGAAAAAIALLLLGNERSAGFGTVREAAPVAAPAETLDLPQRLTRLQAELDIEPAQQAAWSLFESRMLELDQTSRRLKAEARTSAAADERTRHALLFAVALSEIDGALSSAQSSTLNRQAGILGSSFICADSRQTGS